MSAGKGGVGAVSVVATSEPMDGKPMATDLFLLKLVQGDVSAKDMGYAVLDWVNGDYGKAMEYVDELE